MGMGGLIRTQHVCTYIHKHITLTYIHIYIHKYTRTHMHTYFTQGGGMAGLSRVVKNKNT